ncbi:MAG: helix-turn-helix transcriptional regulator [Candidatus Aminicenantes bacterium]|nr:helix-turn-helix transcriptional regulator [Candidatus Aminicenantes bacterium]
MSKNILKNTIKVHRAKNNLTQEQLSLLVGVTRTTINLVERGRWVPSTVLALKIARVFDVPFEEVFYLDTENHMDKETKGG